MRIEVHDGDGTVPTGHGAQQRQGDRVVPADREDPPGPLEQRVGAALDLPDGLLDGEGVDG